MPAEIKTIHGGRIPNQPSTSIIEDLERLLSDAKSGRLVGLAYATASEDGVQGTGWTGEAGSRHPLGTAIMMLSYRYSAGLLEPRREE